MLQPTTSRARYQHRLKRGHGQLYLVSTSARKKKPDRQAVAYPRGPALAWSLCPVCSCRPPRLPLLAGTKLPSRNAFAPSSFPRSSSRPSKAHQRRSQVLSYPHGPKPLRQQVEGEPYSQATSCRRHPMQSMCKIPFRVLRSSTWWVSLPLAGGGSRDSTCRDHSFKLSRFMGLRIEGSEGF